MRNHHFKPTTTTNSGEIYFRELLLLWLANKFPTKELDTSFTACLYSLFSSRGGGFGTEKLLPVFDEQLL